MARYSNRGTVVVSGRADEMYREHLDRRGREALVIYATPNNRQIMDVGDRILFDLKAYTWQRGDKLRKLSHDFYGDSYFWWVLGWFNMKPTDAHWKVGDVVYVPIKLEQALAYYGY